MCILTPPAAGILYPPPPFIHPPPIEDFSKTTKRSKESKRRTKQERKGKQLGFEKADVSERDLERKKQNNNKVKGKRRINH